MARAAGQSASQPRLDSMSTLSPLATGNPHRQRTSNGEPGRPTTPTTQSDAQAGYLFAAQFAASVVSTMMLPAIIARLGFLQTMALSYLLMAAGVAGVGASSWRFGLPAKNVGSKFRAARISRRFRLAEPRSVSVRKLRANPNWFTR